MSQFEGRVIAITGAASGMGLATAKKLLSLGARISVSDINKEALQSAIFTSNPNRPQISGSNILITAIDVRSSVQVDTWIEATIKHFGKLDGAANCAGILGGGADKYRIQELPDDIWKSVLDVNLSGVFYCLKAELKAMQRGGSVVNIASIAGVKGNALNGSYSASKHGVVGLTKTAAQEVGGDGIRVNCVVPGIIDTPMFRNSPKPFIERLEMAVRASPLNRKGSAEEVADFIVYLLGSESSYITGQVLHVDGGILA